MSSRFKAVFFAILGLIVTASAAVPATARVPQPPPQDLVVMLSAVDADGVSDNEFCAAGIILSQTPERTLILTAQHVVTKITEENRQRAQKPLHLAAEFAFLQGKTFRARPVPKMASDQIDYAVLAIDGATPKIDPSALAVLGKKATIDDRVIEVGNADCNRWQIAYTSVAINDLRSFQIDYESTFTREGSSGGALFTADGRLVGMIILGDGRFATARPLLILVEELVRHNIGIAWTAASAPPPEPTERPPEAKGFDGSVLKARDVGLATEGLSFGLEGVPRNIWTVHIDGATSSYDSNRSRFDVPIMVALNDKVTATIEFNDHSKTPPFPIPTAALTKEYFKIFSEKSVDWLECNQYYCQSKLDSYDRIVLTSVSLGFDPKVLPFTLYPDWPGEKTRNVYDAYINDQISLTSRTTALYYRYTFVDGSVSPIRTLTLAKDRVCATCNRIYQMTAQSPDAPPMFYRLDGSRLTILVPGTSPARRVEYDPDGRGFLSLADSYIDKPADKVTLRLTSPAGQKLGPYKYLVDLQTPVLDRVPRTYPKIGCHKDAASARVSCYFYPVVDLLHVASIGVGFSPDKPPRMQAVKVEASDILDPVWRAKLIDCNRDPLARPACKALWNSAGAAFDVPPGTTDFYVQVRYKDGEQTDVQRVQFQDK